MVKDVQAPLTCLPADIRPQHRRQLGSDHAYGLLYGEILVVVPHPYGLGEDIGASFKLYRIFQVDERANAGVDECLLLF